MPNIFKPAAFPKGEKTAQGMAGYDNPRENIDPHIKTKVLDTKEIIISGAAISNIYVSYNNAVSNTDVGSYSIRAGRFSTDNFINSKNTESLNWSEFLDKWSLTNDLNVEGTLTADNSSWALSGANTSAHQNFLQISGANANQNIDVNGYQISGGLIKCAGVSSTGIISGSNLASVTAVGQGLTIYSGGTALGGIYRGTASSAAVPVFQGVTSRPPCIQNADSGTDILWILNSSSGILNVINSAGNLGIGTRTPSDSIHISGGSINISGAGVYKKNGILGAGGTFTTVDLKTVTVSGGIIISIV